MELYPAVLIHGLGDAVAALAKGAPVTLVSAPAAALYAGCGWWRALVEAARAEYPDVPCLDILDCADATGQRSRRCGLGCRGWSCGQRRQAGTRSWRSPRPWRIRFGGGARGRTR